MFFQLKRLIFVLLTATPTRKESNVKRRNSGYPQMLRCWTKYTSWDVIVLRHLFIGNPLFGSLHVQRLPTQGILIEIKIKAIEFYIRYICIHIVNKPTVRLLVFPWKLCKLLNLLRKERVIRVFRYPWSTFWQIWFPSVGPDSFIFCSLHQTYTEPYVE